VNEVKESSARWVLQLPCLQYVQNDSSNIHRRWCFAALGGSGYCGFLSAEYAGIQSDSTPKGVAGKRRTT
jgi:hypothetical protein